MNRHTIRRTLAAVTTVVVFAGVFALAQPAGAVPTQHPATIVSGSSIVLHGNTGTDTLFTIGDPACNNSPPFGMAVDDDMDGQVDHAGFAGAPADPACVQGLNGESAATDNSECATAYTPFTSPVFTWNDSTNESSGFDFPQYEGSSSGNCIPVTLSEAEPVSATYNLTNGGSASQMLNMSATFQTAIGTCTIGPISTTASTGNPGGVGYSTTTDEVTVTAQGVTVSALAASDCGGNAIAAALINLLYGLPGTADLSLTINIT